MKSVFVFGSNTAGIHGAGAARVAYKQYGARWGASYGHYGDSFAIPTKGSVQLVGSRKSVGPPIELNVIRRYVDGFCAFAYSQTDMEFIVTAIGCGLAGFGHEDIAPMFRGFEHTGMKFDELWKPYLQDNAKFWGTF